MGSAGNGGLRRAATTRIDRGGRTRQVEGGAGGGSPGDYARTQAGTGPVGVSRRIFPLPFLRPLVECASLGVVPFALERRRALNLCRKGLDPHESSPY